MNKNTQIGAAMVESMLIFSIMTLLLVAIPKLAKYQDVRQTTMDASRYATWQMPISNVVDREKIIDRMFSRADSPIRSQNSEVGENIYWNWNNQPLIRDNAFIPVASSQTLSNSNRVSESLVDKRTVVVGTTQQSTSPGSTANVVTDTVRTVSNWLGDSDAIAPNRGIVRSDISVALNASPIEGQTTINCGEDSIECLSLSSSILVDGWEAEDSQAVEEGTQVMVPTKLLKPVGQALSVVSVVPLLKEFEEIDDSFGCVNTSTLPTKELTGELRGSEESTHEC